MARGESQSGPAAAPPPEAADVAIVAALGIEVQPLLSRFKKVRKYRAERHTVIEAECAGKLVVLMVGGPGQPRAAWTARLLMAGHRPRWVVSAGYGGALDLELSRNDVVLASQVVDEQGGRYTVDFALSPTPGAPGKRIMAGRLLTVDRIVRTAAEKAALRARHEADVVDMETAAVAAICAQRQVRFMSMRVISDVAGIDLPPEVLSIMGPSGGYRLGAAVTAIWKRPSSLKQLLALREQANEASARLAEVLPGLIAQLG